MFIFNKNKEYNNSNHKNIKISVKEMVVFAMLGAIMYVSKILMEFLPNIHLVSVFVVAFTVVYRKKALYPIYVYVFLSGFFAGFATWWIPYLYIWSVLWGIVMLLPRKVPTKIQVPIYMLICGLHGLMYGLLYAPVQAIFFDFDFQTTVAWVIAGVPWDITHAIGNFLGGILIVPIIRTLNLLNK